MSEERQGSGWDTVVSVGGFLIILAITVAVIVAPSSMPSRQTICSNDCMNNLRKIDAAKEQASLEFKWTNGTFVATGDSNVNLYIKGLVGTTNTPTCHGGGKYTYNPVGVVSTCTIKGHVLPAP